MPCGCLVNCIISPTRIYLCKFQLKCQSFFSCFVFSIACHVVILKCKIIQLLGQVYGVTLINDIITSILIEY